MYEGLTPVSTYVVVQLHDESVLRGERLTLPERLNTAVPMVHRIFTALGAEVSESDTSAAEIRLERHVEPLVLWFAPTVPDMAALPFCVGAIPTVAYLAWRRICDYLVWEQLFCDATPDTLAGKPLVVIGFCEIGRVIARRARALGMQVTIEESDAHRCIEALHEGFELNTEKHTGCRRIAVREIRLAQEEMACGDEWPKALSGFTDEVAAAYIIATAVLTMQIGKNPDPMAWRATCDRLLCDALLGARVSSHQAMANWRAGTW